MLIFEFSWLIEKLSTWIIISTGLIELISAVFIYFYDDKEDRQIYVGILTALLLLDAFIVHCPFTERWSNMGKELSHFSTNVGLAGGLWMIQGIRDDM